MTDKELRKLTRAQLLDILVEQSKRIRQLQKQLDEANARLESRDLAVSEAGSIAEASLRLSGIFEAAQQAADQYLYNVRRQAQARSSASNTLDDELRELLADIPDLGE